MLDCNHWLGHKWSTWGEMQEFQQPADKDNFRNVFQERKCLRCNKIQFASVNVIVPGRSS